MSVYRTRYKVQTQNSFFFFFAQTYEIQMDIYFRHTKVTSKMGIYLTRTLISMKALNGSFTLDFTLFTQIHVLNRENTHNRLSFFFRRRCCHHLCFRTNKYLHRVDHKHTKNHVNSEAKYKCMVV